MSEKFIEIVKKWANEKLPREFDPLGFALADLVARYEAAFEANKDVLLAVAKRIDDKNVGLFVAGREIGRTKLECDAQMHANIINTAHDHAVADAEQAAHSEGYDAGHRIGYRSGFEDGMEGTSKSL